MRVCLFFFVVLCSSFAWADEEKPEKPISELQFYKQLIEFKRKAGKLSGTSIEREARLKEVAKEFESEFASRFIEFDATVSDVKWETGWAVVKVVGKTPGNFGKASGLLVHRELPLKCERESVSGLQRGQNVVVQVHLDWKRQDGSVGRAGPSWPHSPALFYSHYVSPVHGTFVSRRFDIIVGKEVFSFEQEEKSE